MKALRDCSLAVLVPGILIAVAAVIFVVIVCMADVSKLSKLHDLLVWGGLIDSSLLTFGLAGLLLT